MRNGIWHRLLLRCWRRSGGRASAQEASASAQHLRRSRSPPGLTQGMSLVVSAGDGGAGLFLLTQDLFFGNSHQNSHSPKIKMAADLAASHLADFIGFLAPQVGLEPTTLRLTAEYLWSPITLSRGSVALRPSWSHPRIHPILRRLTREYRCLGGIPCAVKLLKVKVRCRLTRKRSLVRLVAIRPIYIYKMRVAHKDINFGRPL